MIFGRRVKICRRRDDTRHILSIFLKIVKLKMAARDKRKTMLCCIFHDLFHVFTLKWVNILFSVRQRTNNTLQTPILKVEVI